MSKTFDDTMVPLAPLLKILQCPVCLDVLKIPFKSCENGHLVCNECNENLPHCPSCRAIFILENPVCVKNILEALPRPCRYSANGCAEILPPEVNNGHERFCGYRPIGCTSLNCPRRQTLLARELKDHYCLNHEQNYDTSEVYTWAFETLHTSAASAVSCRERSTTDEFWVPIFVDDTFFWLIVRQCDGSFLELYFKAVFIGRPGNDVFVRLKFEKDGVGSRFTLRACGDDEWDDKSRVALHETTVDQSISDDSLNFDFEIFTKPK